MHICGHIFSHKQFRRLVKKERRRQKRQAAAKKREQEEIEGEELSIISRSDQLNVRRN